MFRSHPGGWSAARQAVFALLPVVIGAGVLVAGGDGPVTGMLRVEATQSTVAPLLERAAVEAPVEAAPAPAETPAPAATVTAAGVVPATVDAGGPEPAPGAAGASTIVAGEVASPASGSAPVTGLPTTTAPSTSSSTTTTTAPAPVRSSSGRARDAEAEVVPLTNADRVAAGLGTLSRNDCLDAAAAGFAERMARSGVLAHNPGSSAGITGCRANATWGDNVGMSTACDTARLEREWMASPGHRRNILTGAFTLIGVGAWTDGTGTCWVQVLFSS